MAFDYDVIILGSGPAGYSCAMQSTKFDKKVLMVEVDNENIGGTWLNKGTVPSKALREAANLIFNFHTQFGDEKGRKPYQKFRMEDLLHYKMSILDSKNKKVKTDLIKNKVETARGFGKIIGEHTVQITNQLKQITTHTAENILIATGSSPKSPENFEVNHTTIMDYDSILNMTHIPRRMVIVGSGVIAFEFATIFAALGTRITILSSTDDMLPFLDREIKEELLKILSKKNIQIFRETTVKRVESNDLRTCMEVAFHHKSTNRIHVSETDHVLYIGGKNPNSANIGLENLNVDIDDDGIIIVNENFQTGVPNIYAVGDVTGQQSSAAVSFVEGRLAACNMFEMKNDSLGADIPYGIYSIPEISGIGLTEIKARELGIDVTIGRAHFENLAQADIQQESDGILKLVFRTDNLKLLGVHIIGNQATDLIHLGQCVMATGGSIRYFLEHVLNYPTYSEAYRIAAFNGVNRVYKAGVKYKKILER